MKLIKFRRLNKKNWEIAFNQKHLNAKLNGEMAEIIMPDEPWYKRFWMWLFPRKGIEAQVDYSELAQIGIQAARKGSILGKQFHRLIIEYNSTGGPFRLLKNQLEVYFRFHYKPYRHMWE